MPRIGGPSRGCQCDGALPKCLKCIESGRERECTGPITETFFQDMTSAISSGTSNRRRVQTTIGAHQTIKSHSKPVGGIRKPITVRKRRTTKITETTVAGEKDERINQHLLSMNSENQNATVSEGFDSALPECYTKARIATQTWPSVARSESPATCSDSAHRFIDHDTVSSVDWPTALFISNPQGLSMPNFLGPRSTVGATATDPFGVLAMQLNQKNELLVYHYVHVLGPSAGYKSIPLLGPTKKGFDPQKRFWLPMIFSDKVFFHAMLAAAASHRLRFLQSQLPLPPCKDSEMLAMFHKAEACRLINERFTTGEGALSDAALGAVLYLIATELIVGRIEQIYVHLAGLFQMVKLRGGMQTLPRILAFSINFTDTMLALQTLAKPLFPLHEVDWRIRSPRALQHGVTGIGGRLQGKPSAWRLLNSDLCDIFQERTVEIFQEVHNLTRQFEVLDRVITTPEQLDDLEYRCVSVQFHLLSFDYNILQSKEVPAAIDASIKKLCLIATLIFFASGVWRFPDVLPETVQLSEAVSLTQTLLKELDTTLSTTHEYSDVLLWASFFGGFTACDSQRQFYVAHIRALVKTLGIHSFTEVENVLDSFFYRGTVFKHVFLELWETVIA